LLFFVAAIAGLWKQDGLSAFQRRAIGTAILIFLAGVAFLALLSIQFDFGNCINPSPAHPYFTSGRLLSGALIPFAVVYVYGVAWLCRRISADLPVVMLGLIVVFVTASEIWVNRLVFASEHNWFHL
jgi:hypothetical protein